MNSASYINLSTVSVQKKPVRKRNQIPDEIRTSWRWRQSENKHQRRPISRWHHVSMSITVLWNWCHAVGRTWWGQAEQSRPAWGVSVSFLLWSPCCNRVTLQSLVSQLRLMSPLTTRITLVSHCFGTAVHFHFKSQLCMFSSPDSVTPQAALIVTSWFQAILSTLGGNMYVLTLTVPFQWPRCPRLTQRVSSVALFVHFLSRSKKFCDNFGARLLSAGWTDDNNCSTASQQQIMITVLAWLEGEISVWLLH